MSSAQSREAPKADTKITPELVALDRQLARFRRRAARLHRGIQSNTEQWTASSSTLEEALALVDRISSIPAQGLGDIAVKVSAIVWFLEETDAVLDAKGARQLRTLAREARRLAQR